MSPGLWHSIADQLLEVMKGLAKKKGASQVVVVSGHHDEPKREFLETQELRGASVWYVGGMG